MVFQSAKLLAFDLDGTLYPAGVEVGRAVLAAHAEYVKARGLSSPTPDMAWVHQMIGADAKAFYEAMLPDQPEAIQRDFERFCLEYERETVKEHPELYAGAVELLSALAAADRRLVLVSNGGPTYVEAVWHAAGLHRWFSAMYPFSGPEFLSKGVRLRQALADWGGGPAVMIGDRASDRQAAEEAGAEFIGCRYGYSIAGELDGVPVLVDEVGELQSLLLAPEERMR